MKMSSRKIFGFFLVLFALVSFLGCLSEPVEEQVVEEIKPATIDEAHAKWIELYNSSSQDIGQIYTQRTTSYLHSQGRDVYENSSNIAAFLSDQPYGQILSRTSLQLDTSDGNYFEYGYYETAANAEKYAYCILWVRENQGFRKEMEVIIHNALSDTENVGHIEEAYSLWNEQISLSGNIDAFFNHMYAPEVFYYNSYIGQAYYGFNDTKDVYRQWVGSGLQIGTPEVHAMENFQEDISMLFTNWKQGGYQGHAFIIYKRQNDGSWKTLVEFD